MCHSKLFIYLFIFCHWKKNPRLILTCFCQEVRNNIQRLHSLPWPWSWIAATQPFTYIILHLFTANNVFEFFIILLVSPPVQTSLNLYPFWLDISYVYICLVMYPCCLFSAHILIWPQQNFEQTRNIFVQLFLLQSLFLQTHTIVVFHGHVLICAFLYVRTFFSKLLFSGISDTEIKV